LQQPIGAKFLQTRQRHLSVQVSAVKSAKRLKYAGIGQRVVHDPLFVSVQPDGSDVWRLEPVIELLKDGGVSGSSSSSSSRTRCSAAASARRDTAEQQRTAPPADM
jgi:4-alpha-glucanotransferase